MGLNSCYESLEAPLLDGVRGRVEEDLLVVGDGDVGRECEANGLALGVRFLYTPPAPILSAGPWWRTIVLVGSPTRGGSVHTLHGRYIQGLPGGMGRYRDPWVLGWHGAAFGLG